MDYKILGWLNVIILGVLITPFIMVRLNKYVFKTKNKNYLEITKKFRKIHKPLGIALVGSSIYHGYLALGAIRFHTGTVLFAAIAFTVIIG